ncbi:hypothetical protein A3K73_07225 [Candidatus Pacearchaeota archaeon RBG_13_36_9]|nr:MAG: hypothetical protein A3K73_07225 [Candidatus Pacearchaeota archaeon RBG_13_36_9]
MKKSLELELHPDKSRIIFLSRGIDFVGFRNFWRYKLVRKRNIRRMLKTIERYKKGEISKEKTLEIFQGWQAYAKWANTHESRKKLSSEINPPSLSERIKNRDFLNQS